MFSYGNINEKDITSASPSKEAGTWEALPLTTDISQALESLDDALKRKSGSFLNPKGISGKDFSVIFIKNLPGGPFSYPMIECVFKTKTGKLFFSDPRLWPRSDFWVITVELSQVSS